jgi:hypothetical protein
MSRFANPAATDLLTLPGGCQCPGEPHGSDWIRMRTELGAHDYLRVRTEGSIVALLILAVEWNLLDHDGSTAPINLGTCGRLFDDNFEPMNEWIESHVRVVTLPKAPDAPSRNGSRAGDSLTTPTIPTRP